MTRPVVIITDLDSDELDSATVTLDNPGAGDVLDYGVLPEGVTATLANGVLTFTGAATAYAALTGGAYRPEPSERVALIVCGATTAPATLKRRTPKRPTNRPMPPATMAPATPHRPRAPTAVHRGSGTRRSAPAPPRAPVAPSGGG